MAEKPYKAVSYIIKTGIDPWGQEARWKIISTETGETLDDAQGYGYKDAQKAYAAYSYKTRDRSKDEAKRKKEAKIRKWLKENPEICNFMTQIAFEIAKGSWGPDAEFDVNVVKQILKDNHIEVDFSAGEILRVWRKM